MRYFLKELVSTPLYLSNGAAIKWEPAPGDQGLLVTENAGLIKELETAIRRRVGGVIEIDAERYEREKKNSQSTAESNLSSLSATDARKLIAQLQARLGTLEGRVVEEAGATIKTLPKQTTPEPRNSEPLVVPELEPVVIKPKRGKTK